MRTLCVQTPNGQRLPSTDYRDGQFRLRLPNPVQGGDYSCLVPAAAADAACNNGHSDNATVTVDAVEARLALLEAHVTGLEGKTVRLEADKNRLQGQVTILEKNVSTLEEDNAQLQDQLAKRKQ